MISFVLFHNSVQIFFVFVKMSEKKRKNVSLTISAKSDLQEYAKKKLEST
jgi:hypothetical protein